jgi:hypothetical protein
VGDRHRPPLLRLRLGDPLVRLGLVGLQLGADVAPDVDVGDVDREDLVGGAGVQPRSSTRREIWSGFSSTDLWDAAEPIEETVPSPTRAMIVSSPGAADEPLDVGADRDPGDGDHLDAVLGHRRPPAASRSPSG